MNWTNWKTWTAVALIALALFAIYTFASPEARDAGSAAPAAVNRAAGPNAAARGAAGVEPVHLELLDAETGSYRSDRNLFSYKEAPPPPEPKVVPPPPPPDQDKDGVPDFRDNCVSTPNPDQSDLDRDGIGTACETEPEIPPPPPPPTPPAFTWKFIGMFGRTQAPIATFTRDKDILNARVGDIIEGKFILRRIGIESVEIGFVGFPQDQTQRVPLGQ
jgi:hypothetical protein